MVEAPHFPAIQKRKLFEDVAEHLRQLILSQKLKDGQRLPPERELADRFGVGRPSVREALRTLSQMGLVDIRAGEGAFVRKPAFPPFLKSMGDSLGALIGQDGSSLLELCDARRILEVETAAMAAERADPDDIARLEATLKANEAALGVPARFRITDVEFHRAIAQATHNRILLFIHDALSDLMLKTREVALKVPGAAPDAFASHQKIFHAIKGRKPAMAAREMAIHLEHVRGRLERALGKRR
jgi:GntR family transcriptional repressor for pyruvate dehydrogenase complex